MEFFFTFLFILIAVPVYIAIGSFFADLDARVFDLGPTAAKAIKGYWLCLWPILIPSLFEDIIRGKYPPKNRPI